MTQREKHTRSALRAMSMIVFSQCEPSDVMRISRDTSASYNAFNILIASRVVSQLEPENCQMKTHI